MLCTDPCFGYEYWCYIYCIQCVGTTTLCFVHGCIICCMLCTAKYFVPWALLLYILYTVYCHLLLLWALLCFVYAALLYALYHGHCCFMYCMWCVSTRYIATLCQQAWLLLADAVLVRNTILYVTIDHGATNGYNDVIILVYILLILHNCSITLQFFTISNHDILPSFPSLNVAKLSLTGSLCSLIIAANLTGCVFLPMTIWFQWPVSPPTS